MILNLVDIQHVLVYHVNFQIFCLCHFFTQYQSFQNAQTLGQVFDPLQYSKMDQFWVIFSLHSLVPSFLKPAPLQPSSLWLYCHHLLGYQLGPFYLYHLSLHCAVELLFYTKGHRLPLSILFKVKYLVHNMAVIKHPNSHDSGTAHID